MSLFRLLANAGLSLFFDRIEVEGDERVPSTGPLLVVANHTNGLVDGLLLAVVSPRAVSLTAKSALRRNPLLAAGMGLSDTVPLYRRQDGEGEVAKNAGSFSEIRRRLLRGGAVAIFPEGISHSGAALREFRTGAARIAFDFAEHGGSGLRILPMGLHYEAKQRFRSPVWVRFGEPIDFDAWRTGAAQSPRDARALTGELEQRIRALTANFGRIREALWLRWTADLVTTRADDPPALDAEPRRYADRARLLQELQVHYDRADRDAVASLFRDLRRYRRDLRRLGIAPAEVWLSMHPARAAFFILRELELLAAGSLFFAAGAVQHGAAFALDRVLTRMLSKDLDHWASNAIFYGFAIFPLIWLAGIALTATLASRWWAVGYAAVLPFTLLYTILYSQRAAGAFRRARTFLLFVFLRGLQRDLKRRGSELIANISAITDERSGAMGNGQ
jgi:glycerol-3-phosphate O-acyltransferase/dihydroxyacetone phosphate acyltransferase